MNKFNEFYDQLNERKEATEKQIQKAAEGKKIKSISFMFGVIDEIVLEDGTTITTHSKHGDYWTTVEKGK